MYKRQVYIQLITTFFNWFWRYVWPIWKHVGKWRFEHAIKLSTIQHKKTGKDKYSIEVALAGFNKKDVEVEFEDNLLTVKTKQVDKSGDKNEDGEIIHKGISQRQFARSFTIADDVKVNGAALKDGLLTISCERIVPEHKKRKLIEIK